MDKPFSEACERNRDPILALLREVLQQCRDVLEIGSGTGQHAVHFGSHLPHLEWHTSDLAQNHAGIRAWIAATQASNVLAPITLDMAAPDWPHRQFNAVYTANTCHIMSWTQVSSMMAGVVTVLKPEGVFCIYGPFNYNGACTSEGNARFDAALRQQAPHRGIRDCEAMQTLAADNGLRLQADHAMPANNRLLLFAREGATTRTAQI
ncbi:MAG: DUF938 domain-containing protein [Herminiimonas sp.]|nr:DUF938 domain-containing protein [Herminiimonas sp.]